LRSGITPRAPAKHASRGHGLCTKPRMVVHVGARIDSMRVSRTITATNRAKPRPFEPVERPEDVLSFPGDVRNIRQPAEGASRLVSGGGRRETMEPRDEARSSTDSRDGLLDNLRDALEDLDWRNLQLADRILAPYQLT